jgi:ankyrin repeat protein
MKNTSVILIIICASSIVLPGIPVVALAGIASETTQEAEQHFEKANERHKWADYDAAITEYEKVISLSPGSAIAQNAQYWIGQIYFETGQFDAALSIFQELVDEFPSSVVVPTTKIMIGRVPQAKKNRSLLEAVKKGNIDQVKQLISEGADVNVKDEYGETPLHHAALKGHKDVAELLIAKGVHVDAKDKVGSNTPLGLTTIDGHRDVAELLIDKGADVNAEDWMDCPPLYWAAWHGHKDLVEALIAKGADVGHNDKFGDTAADAAIKGRRSFRGEIVKLLIAKGASVSTLNGIYLATYLGDLTEVESYTKQGKDIDSRDKNGRTLLHVAAMAGQKEVLEFLISKGADINAKDDAGNTALEHAQLNHHKDIVKLLLAEGAINTFPKGWWPTGSTPDGYDMRPDTSQKHGGRASACIRSKGNRMSCIGALVQSFKADQYRGKRVQMSAWIKTQDMELTWLRMSLDGSKRRLGSDDMGDRPIKGTTDWHEYRITLDVPESTVGIVFGAYVLGNGQAWIDDFRFEVVGTDVPSTNILTQEQMNQEWPRLAQRSREYPSKPVNLDFEDLDDFVTENVQHINIEDKDE